MYCENPSNTLLHGTRQISVVSKRRLRHASSVKTRAARSRERQRKSYYVRERSAGVEKPTLAYLASRECPSRAYLHGQASISHSRIDLTIVPELPRYLRECLSQPLCPLVARVSRNIFSKHKTRGWLSSYHRYVANTIRDIAGDIHAHSFRFVSLETRASPRWSFN